MGSHAAIAACWLGADLLYQLLTLFRTFLGIMIAQGQKKAIEKLENFEIFLKNC